MKVIGGSLALTLSFVLISLAWAGQDQDKKKKEQKDQPKGKVLELAKVSALSIDSELNDGDGKYGDKDHAKIYEVKLAKGKTYEMYLIMKGGFDPYLYLEDAKKKLLAEDDDSGGGLNSLIVFKAPEDGVYRVIATHFDENATTGNFRLLILEKPEK